MLSVPPLCNLPSRETPPQLVARLGGKGYYCAQQLHLGDSRPRIQCAQRLGQSDQEQLPSQRSTQFYTHGQESNQIFSRSTL